MKERAEYGAITSRAPKLHQSVRLSRTACCTFRYLGSPACCDLPPAVCVPQPPSQLSAATIATGIGSPKLFVSVGIIPPPLRESAKRLGVGRCAPTDRFATVITAVMLTVKAWR